MKKPLKTRIFCTLKQNSWILRFNAVLHFCTLRGQLFRQQPARRVDKAGPRHRREDQGGCLLKCLLNGPPVGGTQETAVGIFAFPFFAVDSPFFFGSLSLSLYLFYWFWCFMPPNPCFQPVQKNLVAWLLIGRLIRSYSRLCKADELVPVVTEEQKKALLWGWDFQEIRLMLLNVVDVWRFKQLTTQHLRLQVGLTMNEEGTDWSSTSGFSRWFCKKADLKHWWIARRYFWM